MHTHYIKVLFIINKVHNDTFLTVCQALFEQIRGSGLGGTVTVA